MYKNLAKMWIFQYNMHKLFCVNVCFIFEDYLLKCDESKLFWPQRDD